MSDYFRPESFKAVLAGLSVLLLVSLGSAQSFTDPGGEETFSTGDISVYTTGTDGIGDRSLNLTGNVTDLSTVESPVEVGFGYRPVGETGWNNISAGTVSSETVFNAVPRSLEPDTEYEFQAYSEYEYGGIETEFTSDYSVSTGTSFSSEGGVTLTGGISGLTDFTGAIGDRVGLKIFYREVGRSWSTVGARSSSGDTAFATELGINPSSNDYEFKAGTEDGINGSVKAVSVDHPFSGGSKGFTTGDFSLVNNGASGAGARTIEMSAETQSLSNLESPIEAYFEIRERGSSDPWKRVSAGTVDSSEAFSATAYNLEPGTEYEFRARTEDFKSTGLAFETTNEYNIDTGLSYSSEGGVTLTGGISNVSATTKSSGDSIDVGFSYRQVGGSWSQVFPRSVNENTAFASELNLDLESNSYEFKATSGDGINGSIKPVTADSISGGVVSFATGTLFSVGINSINDPVVGGEDVMIEALVENEGADGSGTVELNVPGLGSDSQSITLGSGSSQLVNLNVSTSQGDGGTYTANVSSSGDEALQDFSVASLEKPVNPEPVIDSENVGLNQNLSVEANATGDIEMGMFFTLNGTAFSAPAVETGNRSSTEVDLSPGSYYEWNATANYESSTETSNSWNFSTVERPEVLSVEPDGANGVDENPTLNVTVDGSAPVNVTLNNKALDVEGEDPEITSFENVNPGNTVSYDLSNYPDMGEGITERWFVELESKGATWNNSANPYEFTISNISEVNYNLQAFETGDNLAPEIYGGLDEIVGENQIGFAVSNPSGQDMDIEFNLTNLTSTEQVQLKTDVGNNEVIYFDTRSSNMIEENSNYTVQAFYREGQEEFSEQNFTSQELEFSTYVSELSWNHPSTGDVNNFEIWYNESDIGFGTDTYSKIGSTDATNTNVGVANRGLDSNSDDDCYAVRAVNQFGESGFGSPLDSDADSNCLGGADP